MKRAHRMGMRLRSVFLTTRRSSSSVQRNSPSCDERASSLAYELLPTSSMVGAAEEGEEAGAGPL